MSCQGCCVECGKWMVLGAGVVPPHNNELATPVRYCLGSARAPGATYTPVMRPALPTGCRSSRGRR